MTPMDRNTPTSSPDGHMPRHRAICRTKAEAQTPAHGAISARCYTPAIVMWCLRAWEPRPHCSSANFPTGCWNAHFSALHYATLIKGLLSNS